MECIGIRTAKSSVIIQVPLCQIFVTSQAVGSKIRYTWRTENADQCSVEISDFYNTQRWKSSGELSGTVDLDSSIAFCQAIASGNGQAQLIMVGGGDVKSEFRLRENKLVGKSTTQVTWEVTDAENYSLECSIDDTSLWISKERKGEVEWDFRSATRMYQFFTEKTAGELRGRCIGGFLCSS
jgi:hypothetical protein